MNDTERLMAIEAIKQLKALYFYCLDTKRWDRLHEVFSNDAVFDVRGAFEVRDADFTFNEPPISGVTAIIEHISAGLAPMVSVHQGHMPSIELLGPDHAKGVWTMEDWLFTDDGHFHGHGHYHERYVRTTRGWRIESLLLTRLHVESTLKLA